MTWEYRVVKHTFEVLLKEPHIWFDICEVYYNGNKLSYSVKHKAPIGRSPEELRTDLEMMVAALDRPVLEEKGDTLVEVGTDNSEIKQRLERHKKWRRDRLLADYIGPPALWADVDWLTDELERQLERNEAHEVEVEQLRKDSEFAY